LSTGLAGHDVLALADAKSGELLAGTDGGLFRLASKVICMAAHLSKWCGTDAS